VDVERLTDRVREFTTERDWEQFHTPRNLLLALIGEIGELSEIFQWRTDEDASRVMEDEASAKRVRDELADVLYYLLRLADVLGVDVGEALLSKLEDNAQKYPVHLARGSAAKYTEL
jgi:NTP pyrophosphatase (non-canonical NTP hydrolase)